MSLTQYLPLMEGWEFQIWHAPEAVTVVKNRVDLVKRFDDYDGWLIGLNVLCDDCFVNPYLRSPTLTPVSLMPYFHHTIAGMGNWDPNSAYVPMYYRPSPLSSAGLYLVNYFPAYPMPYKTYGLAGKKGEFRVEMLAELDANSTQDSAHILSLAVGRIIITDPKAFKRDLKEVLGAKEAVKG